MTPVTSSGARHLVPWVMHLVLPMRVRGDLRGESQWVKIESREEVSYSQKRRSGNGKTGRNKVLVLNDLLVKNRVSVAAT